MRIIDDTPHPSNATQNMALDAALLDATEPTLRHYLWSEISQTIGRLTPLPEESKTATAKITRRPTGGGLVNHHPDTSQTYALALSTELFKKHFTSISHFYQLLHQSLQTLYPENTTHLFNPTQKKQGTICFRHHSPHDLIDSATDQKLAGAAIRRTRRTLLVQGEIKWTLEKLGPFPKQQFYTEISHLHQSTKSQDK